MFEKDKMLKAIELLKPEGSLFEVRVIYDNGNTVSGYFKSHAVFYEQMSKYRFRDDANFYFTLNTINDACYSRKQKDVFIERPKTATTDKDITAYEWLMVDIDSVRPAGVSASDEQVNLSKTKAASVFTYLSKNGFSEPVVAFSGNGFHLLYPVGLANTDDNKKLVENVLKALDMLFSDSDASIDKSTFNPSRICKLYGTVAAKGSSTEDRPHRVSGIMSIPEAITQTDRAMLEKVAAMIPQPQKQDNPYRSGYANNEFSVDDFIRKNGIRIQKTSEFSGGTKYVLEECVFHPEHKAPDAAIFKTDNGALGYHCFHNSCIDKKWRDVRMLFEPNAYDRNKTALYSRPNYKTTGYVAPKVNTIIDDNDGNMFVSISQILSKPRTPIEHIKTGIEAIDARTRGLRKGSVTCLSGLRGAGKTSLISLLAVEAADQGYRTAIYSGELTDRSTANWILRQAAGKYHIEESLYGDHYRVKREAEKAIAEWLEGRIYIYDNNYGNNFTKIFEQMNKVTELHKVDLIIYDNLMSLNTTMLEKDKFDRQSIFVEMLETYAKAANLHVLFVAHPRKTVGFLRLDDVAGSGDITNRVDSAMILHRKNNDFNRLCKEIISQETKDALEGCTNVVEICKDRETGTQDMFVPLYFDIPSKRLKNSRDEHKVYEWENDFVNESLYGV